MLRLLWCVVRSSAARAVSAAVELVEALSFRVPLPCPVGDDGQRLLTGLAEVFDRDRDPRPALIGQWSRRIALV